MGQMEGARMILYPWCAAVTLRPCESSTLTDRPEHTLLTDCDIRALARRFSLTPMVGVTILIMKLPPAGLAARPRRGYSFVL